MRGRWEKLSVGVSRHQMEQSLASHDRGLGFILHGMEEGGPQEWITGRPGTPGWNSLQSFSKESTKAWTSGGDWRIGCVPDRL